MGKRKYIYLAFFLVFGLMYLGVHNRNQNYDYRWPLGNGMKFAIVAYNDGVDPDDLAYIRHVAESVYGVTTEILPRDPSELQDVYVAGRRQYNIDQLLNKLEPVISPEYYRALVVIHEDVFGEGTNFVLGTGDTPGRLAVMTTKGYGLDHVFHTKIMRVLVLHEIGHTLGLAHCENKCVMRFGNNVIDEAKKYDQYCADCEQKLQTMAKAPNN